MRRSRVHGAADGQPNAREDDRRAKKSNTSTMLVRVPHNSRRDATASVPRLASVCGRGVRGARSAAAVGGNNVPEPRASVHWLRGLGASAFLEGRSVRSGASCLCPFNTSFLLLLRRARPPIECRHRPTILLSYPADVALIYFLSSPPMTSLMNTTAWRTAPRAALVSCIELTMTKSWMMPS